TTPPIDDPSSLAFVLARGRAAARGRLLASACVTSGRQGGALADLHALAAAGASAFTDDGTMVADDTLMLLAMERAAALDLPVLDHALDPGMAADGVIRESALASRLGLPVIPPEAESSAVLRDIRCAEQSGCRLHIQHVSTAEAVTHIRDARRRGLPVSAELTPHHLALCVADIPGDDDAFKMSPPLGTARDRDILQEALVDGTIQAFATDHAPHADDPERRGFRRGPFGVVGLETAVGVTYTAAVESGALTLIEWAARWTTGPASVLGIAAPSLRPGAVADVTVLDLDSSWIVRAADLQSKSANSPFEGRTLKGRAVYTFCGGTMVNGLAPDPLDAASRASV
ncbi:MAG: amidohydrolase family protein, partial [Lentisphaerae bacterium]|nr:amidohydrolase family protein [Lentisphaerota bacterium]